MKYLKTHKQINEGLRDKMVGKSYDEISRTVDLGSLLVYIFDNDLYEQMDYGEKKKIIDRIISEKEIFSIFDEYKNIIRISHSSWSRNMFFNLDNYNGHDVGLYAVKETWKTIKKLL